jgi:hypothetical protein
VPKKRFKPVKTEKDPMIRFRCAACNAEELIPKSVVDFFDIMDGGDPFFPPRFDCQSCFIGKVQPVHYVNHDGIIYNL